MFIKLAKDAWVNFESELIEYALVYVRATTGTLRGDGGVKDLCAPVDQFIPCCTGRLSVVSERGECHIT